MIFAMSSLVKGIVERQLFVLLRESVGRWLVFLTILHCLAKKRKDLSFLFKICNVIIIITNWWNTKYFFY